MTIKEFQEWTVERDRKSGWDNISSLQILSHPIEEIGELAQSINRIYKYRDEVRKEHLENLKAELVDSFWLLVKIASKYNIDLDVEITAFVNRVSDRPPLEYYDEPINSLNELNSEMMTAKSNLQL